MSKRLVKLRGTEDFRRVENRKGGNTGQNKNKGVVWASCQTKKPFSSKIKKLTMPGGVKSRITGTQWLFLIPGLSILAVAGSFSGLAGAPLMTASALLTLLPTAALFAIVQIGTAMGLTRLQVAQKIIDSMSSLLPNSNRLQNAEFSKPCGENDAPKTGAF